MGENTPAWWVPGNWSPWEEILKVGWPEGGHVALGKFPQPLAFLVTPVQACG